MSSNPGAWIGVDLDGTLAMYDGYRGLNGIGAPIPSMVKRVKDWLAGGARVKIMTARVSQSIWRQRNEDVFRTVLAIQDWCEEHIGVRLEVTCIKDYEMTELWDDRAVQVVANTGETLADRNHALTLENARLKKAFDELRKPTSDPCMTFI